MEQLQRINDEQKAKILNTERALKVAEVCDLHAICSLVILVTVHLEA